MQMLTSKLPQTNGICDKSFLLQIVLIIPFVFLCIPSCFSRADSLEKMIPSIKDLIPSILYLILISILREIFACRLFIKLGERYILKKEEWTEEFRKFRIERFALTLFKAIYYFIITPLGVYLFIHEDWMPSALFGAGKSDLSLLWEDYPNTKPVEYIAFYYSVELGYHLHALLYHLYLPSRNDFYEVLLHHLVTVILVVLSYANNFSRIGVLVMILNDVVDATMYAAKPLSDVANYYVTVPFFSVLVVSYAYFRLWVFPRYVIVAAYDAKNYIPSNLSSGLFVWGFLSVLLVALYFLYIYWFALIINLVKKLVTNQKIIAP